MSSLLSFTILGIFTGAAYAIAASGLVLTYSTTRVFNIAHGAFGMVMAFVYWDFSQRQGIPAWVSLALVLIVVAPLFGLFVQRFVTRGLGDAPVSVSLVVTVGLFVGLIGVAQTVWKPAARSVPQFFDQKGFAVGDVFVTYHQLVTILLSAVVVVGLGVVYMAVHPTYGRSNAPYDDVRSRCTPKRWRTGTRPSTATPMPSRSRRPAASSRSSTVT